MTQLNRSVRELELAGLFDADSDYGGQIGRSVKELLEVFATQGHSGASAAYTALLFAKLVDGDTLTPNDHSEYRDVSQYFDHGQTAWQDTRDSRWFSYDQGETWVSVENKPEPTPTAGQVFDYML